MTCRTAINQAAIKPLFGPYVVHESMGGPIYIMYAEGKQRLVLNDEDALRLADDLLRAFTSNRRAKLNSVQRM